MANPQVLIKVTAGDSPQIGDRRPVVLNFSRRQTPEQKKEQRSSFFRNSDYSG
jgi:hypothetical protein